MNNDDDYDYSNYSDDEMKTKNVEYIPNVTFKNPNEVIINNIITRDKMSEAEIKKRYNSNLNGFEMNDTIWCVTNYGQFIDYGKIIQEYETYYNCWFIYPEQNDNKKEINMKEIKYKMPDIFIELINAFINKNTTKIQKCCKKFYHDYQNIIDSKPADLCDMIKENKILEEKLESKINIIKSLEGKINILHADNLYSENIKLKQENTNIMHEIEQLKQENIKIKEEFEKLKQEYNLVKKSMKILKDFCN
jgi:hypothetical protein